MEFLLLTWNNVETVVLMSRVEGKWSRKLSNTAAFG